MDWVKPDPEKESYYLVLKLHVLDKRVYGDFQFKCEFNTGIKTQCKFYFWLNVSALLYNEEVKRVTETRDDHREKLRYEDPDYEKYFDEQQRTRKMRTDYHAPIHFEEFTCIDEDSLK